jgi:FtsH-binding integral membrane protein
MADAWSNPYATPAAEAPESARVAFLRRVGLLLFASLAISGTTGVLSAVTIFGLAAAGVVLPAFVQILLMLVGLYGAQFVGGAMTRSPSAGTRTVGFVLGSVLQGVALGFLLLAATFVSAEAMANPLVLPFQALALVGLCVTGMVVYLLTGPKDLSLVQAGVGALFLPMLGMMAIGIFFPVNGVLGLIFSLVFVGVSAAGLLVNLNQVMYRFPTHLATAAAFHLSVGIVVLFWNVLSLLMRLQRR